jgi:2-oxoglutarate ferredoxin oxidoreductase subunit alpha
MTMKAFALADKYRNPVMILGDGLIGQMMEPVEFPKTLVSEPINTDAWASSGMAFRKSKQRNLVKSLFLDSTELNDNNLALKAKYDQMKKEDVLFEAYNTQKEYTVLVVSYGTMSRVCKTAIDLLEEQGIHVGMIRPQTLFPFPEEAVFKAAAKASCRSVISIELSMGQMVEDVERSVKGTRKVDFFGECGGEVPSPEKIVEILKGLKEK